MIKTLSENITNASDRLEEKQELVPAREEQALRLDTLRLKDGETTRVAKIVLQKIELHPNGCLKWTGSTRGKGYGTIWYFGRAESVHRFVYLAWIGELDGLWVLHKCDCPPCCNPNHLFLGTFMDNVRDAQKKNRLYRSIGELNGYHKLSCQDIIEIRQKYTPGKSSRFNIDALSKVYGVDRTNIWQIVKRKTWRHI